MRKVVATVAAIGSISALGACSAHAQSLGEREYMQYCVACHGEFGHGDGPLADLMTVPVPDLAMIASENDGQFPMHGVIQAIDGRTGIRGHGYPMPVWGDRFSHEMEGRGGDYGTEAMIRGRVLALAEYIATMQR